MYSVTDGIWKTWIRIPHAQDPHTLGEDCVKELNHCALLHHVILLLRTDLGFMMH